MGRRSPTDTGADESMELTARTSVLGNVERMSGQGKHMPGMAARDSQGNAAAAGGSVPEKTCSCERMATADADTFESWLRTELGRLYDGALAEPVPEDMIRLLRAAATKR